MPEDLLGSGVVTGALFRGRRSATVFATRVTAFADLRVSGLWFEFGTRTIGNAAVVGHEIAKRLFEAGQGLKAPFWFQDRSLKKRLSRIGCDRCSRCARGGT